MMTIIRKAFLRTELARTEGRIRTMHQNLAILPKRIELEEARAQMIERELGHLQFVEEERARLVSPHIASGVAQDPLPVIDATRLAS